VPPGESAAILGLMAEIDRQFLETPFYGARQMTGPPASGWTSGKHQADSPLDAADGVDADQCQPGPVKMGEITFQ
jgi:hypothetical protein